MKCTNCGGPVLNPVKHQIYRFETQGRIYCNPQCGYAYRQAHRPPPKPKPFVIMNCSVCNAETKLIGAAKWYFETKGRGYCSKECSKAYRSEVSSATMARTNREHASARMTTKNPMRKAETRAKVSMTLRGMKHKPQQQGGNGKQPPMAELILETLFEGMGFVMQPAIKTRASGTAERFPASYKPDLGHWGLKIAIEADGPSHGALSRQAQDAKKDAFLRGIGWTVLRFTNRQIMLTPEVVVEEVMSTISRLTLCTPMSQAGS